MAVAALANKMARTAWALVADGAGIPTGVEKHSAQKLPRANGCSKRVKSTNTLTSEIPMLPSTVLNSAQPEIAPVRSERRASATSSKR